ncbi:MAG TPA: WecB/TagA/CpsF family glycosyltransferase [Candidatus Lustribacter sp.]|nr:WecB/TagA/CpsF family glycosyltransferase [Candidatus Lustribacter sp.]
MSREDAVARIAALATGPTPALVVTLGVEMVMYARRDPRFRALIDASALSLCDTIGILLASRARHGPLRERVTGIDLIDPLVARSAAGEDLRFFLFGSAPGIAERAAIALRQRHPGAAIVGTRDGYFAPGQSPTIVASIAASGANVLLVGLGSPKQEYWLEENLGATKCGVGIGVGGSFDVLAGTVPRAPRLWRKAGLEWLYRLIREPSRWRRQLVLPQFAFAATFEAMTQRGTRIR